MREEDVAAPLKEYLILEEQHFDMLASDLPEEDRAPMEDRLEDLWWSGVEPEQQESLNSTGFLRPTSSDLGSHIESFVNSDDWLKRLAILHWLLFNSSAMAALPDPVYRMTNDQISFVRYAAYQLIRQFHGELTSELRRMASNDTDQRIREKFT